MRSVQCHLSMHHVENFILNMNKPTSIHILGNTYVTRPYFILGYHLALVQLTFIFS